MLQPRGGQHRPTTRRKAAPGARGIHRTWQAALVPTSIASSVTADIRISRPGPRREAGSPTAVAVGTSVARCPPHRSVRALVSAYGSYLGWVAAKRVAG